MVMIVKMKEHYWQSLSKSGVNWSNLGRKPLLQDVTKIGTPCVKHVTSINTICKIKNSNNVFKEILPTVN